MSVAGVRLRAADVPGTLRKGCALELRLDTKGRHARRNGGSNRFGKMAAEAGPRLVAPDVAGLHLKASQC